jgi:hypothetical protein
MSLANSPQLILKWLFNKLPASLRLDREKMVAGRCTKFSAGPTATAKCGALGKWGGGNMHVGGLLDSLCGLTVVLL